MSIALLAVVALQTVPAVQASPLAQNAATSNYRVLWMLAPDESDGPYDLEEFRELILADVGNMSRNRDGSRTLPIVILRPRVEGQPDREIVVYYAANVNCRTRQFDSGTPRYETMGGPVPLSVAMTWRPQLDMSALGLVQDIVCTPTRAGHEIGRKTRDELVHLLRTTTSEASVLPTIVE